MNFHVKEFCANTSVNIAFHGPRIWRRFKLLSGKRWVKPGVIVAGPFVGELGFEIGEWIPHIKGMVNLFKCRAHVFTRRGHEVLYPFAAEIHSFDFPTDCTHCNWLLNPPDEEVALWLELETRVREYASQPQFRGLYKITEVPDKARTYKVFRHKVPLLLKAPDPLTEQWKSALPSGTKIILTLRASARGYERNSNVETVRRAAEFVVQKGWTPIIVGKVDAGYSVPELPGINLINKTSLSDLVAIYRLSRAVVGSSTGIIHLAAACGVPHITWGSTYSNDKVVLRYNRTWNLNGTWVRFISKDWDVNVEDISAALTEAVAAVNKTKVAL